MVRSEGLGQLVRDTWRDLGPMDDWWMTMFGPAVCFRWCCWRAARATAAAPLALTHSSPSARCSKSPSRAPAPAAVRTRPSWRRWGCTAPTGDVSQPLTDTSSPAAVKSAAKRDIGSPRHSHHFAVLVKYCQKFVWRMSLLETSH